MTTAFDDQLDTMLTKEDAPADAPVEESETATDDSVAAAAAADQPQTSAAELPAGTTQPEVRPRTGATDKPGVPLHVVSGLRQTIRDLRQDQAEQERELAALRSELAEARKIKPPSDQAAEEFDDEEPMTRADLRKLEAKRLEEQARYQQDQAERERQAQAEFVKTELLKASPSEAKVLTAAQEYFSPRDVARITQSRTPLATAMALAKARIQAFGTEDELAILDSTAVLNTERKTQTHAPSTKTAPTQQPSPPGYEDESPRVRAVLDMFRT